MKDILIGLGYFVLYPIIALLGLVINAYYWGGILKLLGKLENKLPYLIIGGLAAVYLVVGIWLDIKLIDLAEYIDKWYKRL